jgi:hypothetical protein
MYYYYYYHHHHHHHHHTSDSVEVRDLCENIKKYGMHILWIPTDFIEDFLLTVEI